MKLVIRTGSWKAAPGAGCTFLPGFKDTGKEDRMYASDTASWPAIIDRITAMPIIRKT
jgi:hypothetical protein